jgi:transcriptional regulator with XRE-family HTH domain
VARRVRGPVSMAWVRARSAGRCARGYRVRPDQREPLLLRCLPSSRSDMVTRAHFCTVHLVDRAERVVMISPYVRRRRLAVELAGLRGAAGLTHEALAEKIGQSRMKISRLENARIPPDEGDVVQILDVLGVTGKQWSQLVDVARDAAGRGWWGSFGNDMGARQALYADLETGAAQIREYQPSVPGLLQTVEFAQQRHVAESQIGPVAFQNDRAVEARQMRQKMLLRSEGPTYEVVLDEVAVRRLHAPPEVVAAQVRHLITLAKGPRITVRVLPTDAVIAGYVVPRSAFSLYTYPDELDPYVVAVDTVTTDVVLLSLTDAVEVQRYTSLYERLAKAALSTRDSLRFLAAVADQWEHQGET